MCEKPEYKLPCECESHCGEPAAARDGGRGDEGGLRLRRGRGAGEEPGERGDDDLRGGGLRSGGSGGDGADADAVLRVRGAADGDAGVAAGDYGDGDDVAARGRAGERARGDDAERGGGGGEPDALHAVWADGVGKRRAV